MLHLKSSFLNLVHNDQSLPTVDKFNYLLNRLLGSALEVVQSIQVTADNCKKPLERLNAFYDNDVLIFSDCILSLFAIPTMKHPESASLQKADRECISNTMINSFSDLRNRSWKPLWFTFFCRMSTTKLKKSTMKGMTTKNWQRGLIVAPFSIVGFNFW